MLDLVAHLRDGSSDFIRLPTGRNRVVIVVGMHDNMTLRPRPGEFVIGFEPDATELRRQRKALRRVFSTAACLALPAAVSDRDGVVMFSSRRRRARRALAETGAFVRGPDGTWRREGETATPTSPIGVPVNTVRLEPLLRVLPPEVVVSFLKIDTQGGELNVVKGCGARLAARVRRSARRLPALLGTESATV